MRLRHVLGMASVAAVIGGGIWFFVNGTSGGAVGPGGLPLIKADTRPIKIAPEEPGGEVMPNADSTVFSAMGADTAHDPSMENLKLPADEQAPQAIPDFAGLKTGFALPSAPPRTTENLFGATPSKTASDYVSGLAPEALAPAPETAPPPQPVKEDVKPAVKAPEPAVAPAPKMAGPVPAQVPQEPAVEDLIEEAANPAQALEAQEKAMITPAPKPVTPPGKPAVAATPAKEAAPSVQKTAEKPKADVPLPLPVQEGEKTVASTSGKSGYYMQLASTPSQTEAPKLWARLQGKYPDALAGLRPVYQTANVPGRGEYIRVQAGPLTQEQATARCKKLHAVDAKGGCLVLRR